VNTREQISASTSAPGGADAYLPPEFSDMIAAMEVELAAHVQALSAQVSNAGAAHRETLRRLDSLLANWGKRLQNQYADVLQLISDVEKQYESTLQEFQAFTLRYDSVQQQLKGVEHQYDSVRQEQEALSQRMQEMQQQFEATLAQCKVLLGYERQFESFAEMIRAFEEHLATNNAEFAKLCAATTVSRRWDWLAMAVAILALIIAGYVGLARPG